MLNRPLDAYTGYDKNNPGFIESVAAYENAILPSCPKCGSYHTAQVTAGIVSRSIHLASATTKFVIRLSPLPGKLYCNDCGYFFSPRGWKGPIWWEDLIEGY